VHNIEVNLKKTIHSINRFSR